MMGYTHYWKIAPKLGEKAFSAFSNDCRTIAAALGKAIPLASYNGKGKPEFSASSVAFNGVEKCGHEKRDLGITWPSDGAKGISFAYEDEGDEAANDKVAASADASGRVLTLFHNPDELALSHSDVGGHWFAGAQLRARTCDGDCSHETFHIDAKTKVQKWQEPENGLIFSFCKTAFKPYDLAVQACLIAAKRHFGDQIIVSSDGNELQWNDARAVCQKVLGYGVDFKLPEE